MGFEEVTSLDADVTVALGKKDKAGKPYPKMAEGYYLGSREVESKRGPSKIHFLKTAKGNLGVWGTTDLNRKLSQARVGTMLRITSTGTKDTPNGPMYTYKVEVDKNNVIDIVSESEDTSNNNDDSYEADADTEDEVEAYEPEAYKAAVSKKSAAERKADVEALLKGNRNKVS